ncbi:MAG: hypothetical protein NWQ54_06100 [Paraglaciecola sp.]|uniref:hypothetical protein n=1 Tax=Paraglaciecola sp. TaxID=1920173 RepID=UPI00273FF5B2|nr:hypothetical protein [Paraglaciecola sp.]MDP5030151.1 hypothetical protein [Paraglaciecola sp.]MDP5130436.1 hypothetical protein [Paraglaciecola sp.]
MDMSLKEKSTWVSLISTIGVFGYYFYGILGLVGLPVEVALDNALSLAIKIITIIVMLEIIFQSLLAVSHHREANLGNDERDKIFNDKSHRISYVVLVIGVFVTLGRIVIVEYNPSFTAELNSIQIPMLTAHILLLSFILAEVARFISLIFYYRRGR